MTALSIRSWEKIHVSSCQSIYSRRVMDGSGADIVAHATQSKFALVCGECFRHNGLVGSKYEWERMRES
jgi:hypothetical protein